MQKDLFLENIKQPAIDLLNLWDINIYHQKMLCYSVQMRMMFMRDVLRGQFEKWTHIYAGVENRIFKASNIERAMEDIDYPLTEDL